jgi:hypothetical protein
VLAGQAGDRLLDSYHEERHAIAELAPASAAATGELESVRRRNAPMVTMGYRYDSSAVLGPIVPIPSTEDIEASLDATPGSGFPNGDQSVYFGPCRIALHGLRRRGLVRGHPEGRCPRAVRTDDAGVLLVRPDGRSPATADAATLDDVQAAVTGCLPTPGS